MSLQGEDIPQWQLDIRVLEQINREWEMMMDVEFPYWREYLASQ